MHDLRRLFSKREDPYWGVDLDLARRMASMFILIGVLFSVTLWPLSPLSDQIGNTGWLICGSLCLLGLVTSALLFWRPEMWGFRAMGVMVFLSVVAIFLGQWLAGGTGEPYENLVLIPMLFVAAIYPPRVIAAFLALIAVGLVGPLVYDEASGEAAANALGLFLLLVGLAAAVRYLLLRIRVQGMALARGEEDAREEARLDELTTIGNRRAFEEALADEISRAERMGTPLSMAMGDVEHFKRINDEFGHLEGDRSLHGIAKAMDQELRAPDRVFRWGGDEFALLLPGADKGGAHAVIERLQAKVSVACRRPDSESIWIHFAAAQLQPRMTQEELTEAADLALMAERSQDRRERA
jgi:diguanylate cyclase (GGDEF)-like protein